MSTEDDLAALLKADDEFDAARLAWVKEARARIKRDGHRWAPPDHGEYMRTKRNRASLLRKYKERT